MGHVDFVRVAEICDAICVGDSKLCECGDDDFGTCDAVSGGGDVRRWWWWRETCDAVSGGGDVRRCEWWRDVQTLASRVQSFPCLCEDSCQTNVPCCRPASMGTSTQIQGLLESGLIPKIRGQPGPYGASPGCSQRECRHLPAAAKFGADSSPRLSGKHGLPSAVTNHQGATPGRSGKAQGVNKEVIAVGVLGRTRVKGSTGALIEDGKPCKRLKAGKYVQCSELLMERDTALCLKDPPRKIGLSSYENIQQRVHHRNSRLCIAICRKIPAKTAAIAAPRGAQEKKKGVEVGVNKLKSAKSNGRPV
ncbi:unnamed protein product [Ranitomeya imitator]|uniref:Uncharacterized protein n=1 Tax=Ranitomeya imitator TaxID=111125 RepID=A0ABN9MKP4_9NEOB|nr:unnamed protein product [Ranitomeya imitator]